MTLVTKIRTAAFMQASLRAFFGSDFATFRMFDRQLKQGALAIGTCCIITTISEITTYLHPGPNPLTFERVQFDVLSVDADEASDAADAICSWLNTGDANFITNGMFASPVVYDPGPSNFRLNRRGGLWPTTNRPVPMETLDYRVMNVAI
jgi:hypothetical protein